MNVFGTIDSWIIFQKNIPDFVVTFVHLSMVRCLNICRLNHDQVYILNIFGTGRDRHILWDKTRTKVSTLNRIALLEMICVDTTIFGNKLWEQIHLSSRWVCWHTVVVVGNQGTEILLQCIRCRTSIVFVMSDVTMPLLEWMLNNCSLEP